MSLREHGHLFLGFHLGTKEALISSKLIPREDIRSFFSPNNYAPNVPFYSWLPPAHLIPAEAEDVNDMTINEQGESALLTWLTQARHRIFGSSYEEQIRARQLERTRTREQRRLKELQNHPFAVTADGIFVVNFFGSHDHWHRALDNAIQATLATHPEKTIRQLMFDLMQRFEKFKMIAHVRSKAGRIVRNRSINNMAHHVLKLTNKTKQKDTSLLDTYILEGLPEEQLAIELTQHLWSRVRIWISELKRTSSEETSRWSSNSSCQRFLDLVQQGKFFLFEIMNAHPTGARHGYTNILAGYPLDYPLCIGLALRELRHAATCLFLHPDTLFRVFLHEMAHILDAGDPHRPMGKDTPLQHQPGHHDVTFYRAYHFNLILAVRAGLMKEHYSLDDDPPESETFPAPEAYKKMDPPKVSPEELRQILHGSGIKRTVELPFEEDDEDAMFMPLLSAFLRVPRGTTLTREHVTLLRDYYRQTGEYEAWITELVNYA